MASKEKTSGQITLGRDEERTYLFFNPPLGQDELYGLPMPLNIRGKEIERNTVAVPVFLPDEIQLRNLALQYEGHTEYARRIAVHLGSYVLDETLRPV
jgi:hypothetical protein